MCIFKTRCLLALSAILATHTSAGTTRIIALDGDPIRNTEESVSVSTFYPPSLNETGQLAFKSSGQGTVYRATSIGIEVVARSGDLFAGTTREFDYANTAISISNTGFMATNARWGSNNGVVSLSSQGITIVGGDGDSSPFGDALIDIRPDYKPAINDAGQIAFSAHLIGGSSNSAMYRWSPMTETLTELVRDGQSVPAENGFFQSHLTSFEVFPSPVMNNAGDVVFVSEISGSGLWNDQGIYIANGNTVEEVVRKGDSTPSGDTFDHFTSSLPEINDFRQVAFLANVTGTSLYDGVYLADQAGIRQIARVGLSAPGTNGFYRSFLEGISLSNSGHIAYLAEVRTDEGNALRDRNTLYVADSHNNLLQVIAVEGQQGPAGLGIFGSFASMYYDINDLGQVAFSTNLSDSGDSREGLFLHMPDTGLRTVAYEGMPLLGSTVVALSFAGTYWRAGGYWGNTTGLNNQGQVAYAFQLADGRDGIALWSPTVVALLPGDFSGDGRVDGADYTIWRDTVGSTGASLAADANGDQVVNSLDYDVWRSNFGITSASLFDGANTVPEPPAIASFLVAGLLATLSTYRKSRFSRQQKHTTAKPAMRRRLGNTLMSRVRPAKMLSVIYESLTVRVMTREGKPKQQVQELR